ncbi:restriction endonuclease subunit S [Staphylococcus coagulans]|uniref:restriction endonuclease subunit S n=1 Tax=Staphylococcus coagulans TaxID=74706 RepID=UPI003364BD91
MTNETKNVPELRFPEFEGEWDEKRLGESINVQSGRDYKHLDDGDYPVYGTGGYMCSVSDYLYKKDAIGIGRKGTINKPYLLKGPFWTVDTLFYCIPKDNEDVKFILNLFRTINWKIFDESTGVPSLSKLTINRISKYFPKFEEQQKIGDFFSKLDCQIELEEKKLALLEEQKKGYMQKIFSQELRFKDENEGDYPEWKIKKIEDIASVTKGFTPSTKNNDYWHDENRNWLSIAGMDEKYLYHGNKGITDLASQKHDKVDKNTLIMSFKLTLGKLGIVKEPMYTNEAICHFNWKSKDVNTEYVYYYLSHINISSFGSQAVKGITLNNDSINSIVIKLPSLSEQYKITDLLKKYDEFIEKQLAKVELLKERKKGFLQKMFI